jgi:hypothetical protein
MEKVLYSQLKMEKILLNSNVLIKIKKFGIAKVTCLHLEEWI